MPLRRLRAEHPALYDANVNGWLARTDTSYLVRCLRDDRGGGVARAFLSSGYKIIDSLDVLMAALDGLRQAGVPAEIDGCNLTPRRRYVRVVSPAIRALAPSLLAGYRSPFTGQSGAANPVVFAGWVLSNSETGCGAFSITPRLVPLRCKAIASARLGERQGRRRDPGPVAARGSAAGGVDRSARCPPAAGAAVAPGGASAAADPAAQPDPRHRGRPRS